MPNGSMINPLIWPPSVTPRWMVVVQRAFSTAQIVGRILARNWFPMRPLFASQVSSVSSTFISLYSLPTLDLLRLPFGPDSAKGNQALERYESPG